MGKLKNGVKSSQLWQIISPSILTQKIIFLHKAPLTHQKYMQEFNEQWKEVQQQQWWT